MQNGFRKIFVEFKRPEYRIDEIIDGQPIFNESEVKFLEKEKLITKAGNLFKVNFVGELITPNYSFFSFPKNFKIEPEKKRIKNIEIIKKVLENYKGNSLITNTSFFVSRSGEIQSEKFYYEELKYYFLDYITYEFIYPRKPKLRHSTNPITGGKVDIYHTMKNRKFKGPGITYKVKDVENSEKWKLDDIYWSVIDHLANKYNDRTEIDQMFQFLKDEGYKIETLKHEEFNNSELMIEEIEKCDVGIIHTPIKNILLTFFESMTVGSSFKINAFYTDKFQYVWEDLVRKSLSENSEFRKLEEQKFKRTERRRKWFSSQEELDTFVSITNRNKKVITVISKNPVGSGFRLTYEIQGRSIPDLFSHNLSKNLKFIGDAKYYQDPENADFEKEFKTYNTIVENKYPMVVFVPGDKTKVLHVREETIQEEDLEQEDITKIYELIIFTISVEEAINDAVFNSSDTIDRVLYLINKNTIRKGDEFLGGFH
jgi:hypothetical protein